MSEKLPRGQDFDPLNPPESPPPGSADATRPQPRSKRPLVTWALCLTMLTVWICEIFVPSTLQRFAFAPAVALFEPWRFLTAAFLHAFPSPFHVGFNVWALWVVGRALEPLLGHVRFAAAFVIFAVGGMLAQCLVVFVNPQAWLIPTVGASGSVFGFFGMVLAIQKVLRIPSAQMAVLIGINFVIGFLFPNIAWVAHLGGLILGLVLGFYTGYVLRHPIKSRSHLILRDIGCYGVLFLLLVGLNWLFYHFNYHTIYALLSLVS